MAHPNELHRTEVRGNAYPREMVAAPELGEGEQNPAYRRTPASLYRRRNRRGNTDVLTEE